MYSISKLPTTDVTGQWATRKNMILQYQTKWNFQTHLCDFFCDIVSSVFDLWRYDGCLGCWRRMSLLISPLREVECNQRDLVDGAILVDVRIRGRAKQAGLHVIKRAWWFRTNSSHISTFGKLISSWLTSLYSVKLAINLAQCFKCIH